MSKGTAKEKVIIALAYFHRYGWIVAMMICAAVWFEQIICIFSVGCITFSFWSFIGYKNKWKHIYCSFQDAYHQKNECIIDWDSEMIELLGIEKEAIE